MKIMRLALVVSLLMFLLPCRVVFAQAPIYPHFFYGSVEVYSEDDMSDIGPAPVDTVVTAEVAEEVRGSVTVITAGTYGGPGGGDPKLVVQDTIPSGTEITFYVIINGDSYEAEEVRVKEEGKDWEDVDPEWVATFTSGEVWGLDLRAKLPAPPQPPPPSLPTGGGGGPPAVITRDIEVVVDEESVFYDISRHGELLEDVWRVCDGCGLTLSIPEGTIALDEEGDPLDIVELTPDETPLCSPPEDGYIIGTPCNFEPDGASFDPPCEVTVSYAEADIPEDVAEEDLVYGYCDETTLEWVVLEDFEVDTVNNTITARVPEFTTFTILGFVIPPPPAAFSVSDLSIQPAELEVAETVTITVLVANTGGREGSYTIVLKINGVKEAEDSVTVAPGRSQDVTFTVTKADAGSYSVDVNGLTGSFTVKPPPPPPPPEAPPAPPVAPPPPGINWAILGPIIAVAVFLAIFLPVRQRRRRAG